MNLSACENAIFKSVIEYFYFMCFEMKNHSVQGRWDLENIIWYLGSDSKRSAPTE
jgi:hypothetical protein